MLFAYIDSDFIFLKLLTLYLVVFKFSHSFTNVTPCLVHLNSSAKEWYM